MEVLVLNSGSSSVKFELFEMPSGVAVSAGLIERVGGPGGPPDHETALRGATSALRLHSPDLVAIGHRVVHGGARFRSPALIDGDVLLAIEELAPLHNPPNLAGIAVTRDIRPDLPQVAVFDTAFHATIPRVISRAESPVAVCVVPTNEELEVARQILSIARP